MRRKFLAACLLASGLSGCNQLPDPALPQPGENEAKDAFVASNLDDADLLEAIGSGETSGIPIEIVEAGETWMNGWESFKRANTIANLRDNKAYDRIVPANCEWQWLDPENVDDTSRPRVSGEAIPAYYCDVEIFVTQNYGIKVSGQTKGYFFRAGEEWRYAGLDPEGYTRTGEYERRAPGTFGHTSKGENSSNWGD